jgi:hypothetical protein
MVPGGASTYTYSNSSSVVTPTTDATYTVTGTSAEGCVSSTGAVSSVTVNALPVIVSESGSVTVCGDATGTFSVVANNTDTYAWVYSYNSGPETLIDGTYNETGFNTALMQIPTLESEGWDGWDITCILTSAEGCTVASAPKLITVNPLPTFSVNSGVVCAGASFTMVPSGTLTYSYSNGSDVVVPASTDEYTVTGTDANGCSNTAISSVTVNMLPSVSAVSNNTLLCVGETATLSVSGASSYTWSTAENMTDIAVSPTVQTTYTVMGTDGNGCVGTTMITQNTDLCTGLAQIAGISNEINVYPNPSNGIFNIHISTGYNITILDVLGKVIYTEQLQGGTYTINLSHYANGLYILKAESNGVSKTVRLVKH